MERISRGAAPKRKRAEWPLVRVLVTGASGLIGGALVRALHAAGHFVIGAARRAAAPPQIPADAWLRIDYTHAQSVADWLPRLRDVDAVINAVGIIRERGAQTFAALHERTPQALFAACAQAGVKRVLQISALGADAHAQSRYHLSKKAADDFLLTLPLTATVVQPSLIFAPQGASAQLFLSLASLPLIPLVGTGEQRVQPIHIDDCVEALLKLLTAPNPPPRLALVGPQPLSLRDFLASLRQGLGPGELGPARFLPVPVLLLHAFAYVAQIFPRALLTPETLSMLLRGNVADPAPTQAQLGRAPRPVAAFAEKLDARTLHLPSLFMLMRVSIAFVWIYSGVVSLWLFPLSDSYALLARVGLHGTAAAAALYAAALADLAFGAATLWVRATWIWPLQLLLIGAYSVIIAFALPEFWIHPFAPLAKNIPMMAGILMLWIMEQDGLRRR